MGRLRMAAALVHGARAARRQWQDLPPDRRERLQVLLRALGIESGVAHGV